MAIRRLILRPATSPVDTDPPTVPGIPASPTTVTGPFSCEVRWDLSSDNRSVSGYDIEVNGVVSSEPANGGSITLSGLTASTSYNVRIRAFDGAGNRSAWTSNIGFTTQDDGASGGGGDKNWNPGNYLRPDHRGTPVKDLDHEGAWDAIHNHANFANIPGVLIPVPWARLENVSGVYNWTWLDDKIDYITEGGTNHLQVMLNLEMYSYGTSTVPSTPQDPNDAIVPDYIIAAGWCGGGNGIMPKIDVAGCRDRIINIMGELSTRYGNRTDVEMIGLGETSRSYTGQDGSAYNDSWIAITEALVDQMSGKKAWGFVDHNGLINNDYAKQRTLQNIMDTGGIAYSIADIIGFFSKSAAPPGVDISVRGPQTLLEHMNYGYSANFDYDFTNPTATDRRLWVPSKAENQVIRPSDLTNAKVKWYSDNWYKNTHPVWTLRIGAGGASYGANFYNTSTPAPADFNGTNTLDYVANLANAPANVLYPTGPV
jgi:hypothetical protein